MVSRELIARQCICCGSDQLCRSSAVLMPFVAMRVFGHEPVEITAEWGLRDLRQGMAYTLCNSLQCQRCGALFLDYRFTDEQMEELYRGYRNDAYTRERDCYEPGYALIATHYQKRENYISDVERWLASYLPEHPVVLDWGGGSGLNTPFLGRCDQVFVYDLSSVPVIKGAVRAHKTKLKEQHYDLIVCSQVLEHVPYPLDLIEEILPVLGRQGLLYIEVPHEVLMRENSKRLDLAGKKRHWHEHINFFTEESLRCLLARAGLVVIDSYCLSIDLGWRESEVIGVLARCC